MKIKEELDFLEDEEIQAVIIENEFDERRIDEHFKKFAVDEK